MLLQLLEQALDERQLGGVDELALLDHLLREARDVRVLVQRLQLDPLHVVLPLRHDRLPHVAEHRRLHLVVHDDGAVGVVGFDEARLDLAAHVARLRLPTTLHGCCSAPARSDS